MPGDISDSFSALHDMLALRHGTRRDRPASWARGLYRRRVEALQHGQPPWGAARCIMCRLQRGARRATYFELRLLSVLTVTGVPLSDPARP